MEYVNYNEYVLPSQDNVTAHDCIQPQLRPPKKYRRVTRKVKKRENVTRKKEVIQDVYDENHYTLARNSGFVTYEPKYKGKFTDINTTRKILIFLCALSVMLAIGGVIAYGMIILQGILISIEVTL